eukprot:1159950-Pelagomonas_calceolata.AAC.4
MHDSCWLCNWEPCKPSTNWLSALTLMLKTDPRAAYSAVAWTVPWGSGLWAKSEFRNPGWLSVLLCLPPVL